MPKLSNPLLLSAFGESKLARVASRFCGNINELDKNVYLSRVMLEKGEIGSEMPQPLVKRLNRIKKEAAKQAEKAGIMPVPQAVLAIADFGLPSAIRMKNLGIEEANFNKIAPILGNYTDEEIKESLRQIPQGLLGLKLRTGLGAQEIGGLQHIMAEFPSLHAQILRVAWYQGASQVKKLYSKGKRKFEKYLTVLEDFGPRYLEIAIRHNNPAFPQDLDDYLIRGRTFSRATDSADLLMEKNKLVEKLGEGAYNPWLVRGSIIAGDEKVEKYLANHERDSKLAIDFPENEDLFKLHECLKNALAAWEKEPTSSFEEIARKTKDYAFLVKQYPHAPTHEQLLNDSSQLSEYKRYRAADIKLIKCKSALIPLHFHNNQFEGSQCMALYPIQGELAEEIARGEIKIRTHIPGAIGWARFYVDGKRLIVSNLQTDITKLGTLSRRNIRNTWNWAANLLILLERHAKTVGVKETVLPPGNAMERRWPGISQNARLFTYTTEPEKLGYKIKMIHINKEGINSKQWWHKPLSGHR